MCRRALVSLSIAIAIVCVGVLAAGPPARAAEGCAEDAALHRPEVGAPLPEATGGVLVRAGGDVEAIEIHVYGVPAELPLDVTLHDGDHVLAMGTIPAGVEGRVLVRSTAEGGTLPGDVAHVSEIFEYEIVVAEPDSTVVLRGRVPVVACPHEGGGHEPGGETPPLSATSFFGPPPGEPTVAGGKITVTRRGDRDTLQFDLAGLPPRLASTLRIDVGLGDYADLAAFYVDDRGAARLAYGNGPEETMPFGSLDALIGSTVAVLDPDGDLVLVGVIPAFGEAPEGPPDVADVRTPLVRPEAALLPAAGGGLRVGRDAPDEHFAITVTHVRPFHELELRVATSDPPTSGETPLAGFALVAALTADGAGALTFERNTAVGDPLPLGASLAELAGREVRIVDAATAVTILRGRVPPLADAAEPVRVAARRVDETTGAAVRVAGRMNPRTGRDALVFDLRRLPRDSTPGATSRGGRSADRVRLFFEDAAAQMVEVRDVAVRAGRRARMRFRTRSGDALPGGASSLRELSGRAFEIRVGNTPAVRGFVPFF